MEFDAFWLFGAMIAHFMFRNPCKEHYGHVIVTYKKNNNCIASNSNDDNDDSSNSK